ncbi:9-O-acetylesterase, partial [Xanthomonas perforans]|nr:9-O-acetylesterase [Xanthomonas perforans]
MSVCTGESEVSACRVKILIGTLSALLLPQLARAADAPLLHPVFQDHAVLQRDAPIRLWGDAAPGTRVTVQLDSAQVQTRADR